MDRSTAIARIKGGMPVRVNGYVGEGETEILDIHWFNTDRPVSQGFRASLNAADWAEMEMALEDAYYYP